MTNVSRTAGGRPRDPAVDQRAMDAAVELFGESGWSAVSIDKIARRSGLSKRSIYLRWANKDALLAAALRERLSVVDDVDTGTLRGDLVQLVGQLIELYAGAVGMAALRLALGAGEDGSVFIREELRQSQVHAARALVARSVATGELPTQTSPTLLLDTVCGAALNHVVNTPTHQRSRLRQDAQAYASALVDFVIRGLGCHHA